MTIEQNRVIERTETKLVGYSVSISLNEALEKKVIEDLRGKLAHNRQEISNQLEQHGMYLVQVYSDCEWTPDVPFESIVAIEVSTFSSVPEGMIEHTLPSGHYAKFTHYGSESAIGNTYDFIRETNIASNRAFDFEYWTNVNSLGEKESVIDIYLPLDT
ncbi:GyrI-like domain-containing protein [Paenibacillus sp. GCM10012307]|uniref:GyrI-like domain-containing protein n=1 Tax=Paenibacillus roseus TaxID=2798579 RepID=A0A934J9E0_9BACL|nr:GyrI-like domain-containing protein [Paenibacillus roseus]MBJ6362765.1 GyrI-like domain-containing protein [Paenibacillus roseus]